MAGFLSIEVSGLTELQAALDRAVRALDDPRDLLDALGATLEANINLRFETKTDPNGTPWAPLSPATLAIYAAEDGGKRRGTLLERTGQMINSLTHNVGPDYVQVGMSRLTDGGQWALPLLHETGTTRMPRRGIFLGDWELGTLGAQDEADLLADIDAWLDDALQG